MTTSDWVSGWNVGAAAVILVPLLIFLIACSVSDRGFANWDFNGGGGILCFAYVYMIVLFAVVVVYGNRVLKHRPSSEPSFFSFGMEVPKTLNRAPFIMTIAVFMAMTLLVMVLIGAYFCNFQIRQAAGVANNLSSFGTCVVLTLLGMLLFLGIHSFKLRKQDGDVVLEELGSKDQASDEEANVRSPSWFGLATANQSSRSTKDGSSYGLM